MAVKSTDGLVSDVLQRERLTAFSLRHGINHGILGFSFFK